MARTDIVLSIFIASPSDVDEERDRFEEVIKKFNHTWSRHLEIRFELFQGTDAIPDLGKEGPQSVINNQIPDYDLFIGIMWHQFGTPTNHAGSGTEEEFNGAKKRRDENPDVRVMFYFKQAAVPIEHIDPEQLDKVKKFKSSLGEQALYKNFQTADDFQDIISEHLLRLAQEWRSKSEAGELQPPSTLVEKEKISSKSLLNDSDEDEKGFLDLVEESEVEFSVLAEITARIAKATENVNNRMEERKTELINFSAGPDSTNRKVAKRLIAKAAADMDDYTYRVESEIPSFGLRLNSGIDALTKAARLSIEFDTNNQNSEQIKENISQINEILRHFISTERVLEEFRDSAASLPRLTTRLNRSKRSMVNAIQKLIDNIHSAKTKIKEADIALNLFLNK